MPSPLRIVLACAAAMIATGACASPKGPGGPGGGPPGQGGRGGGMMMGGGGGELYSARPVALLFVSMDTDHDLFVTRAELDAGIKAEWAHADADKTGEVSGFELIDWSKAVLGNAEAEPSRVTFDTDFSGMITQREFEDGLARAFLAMDKNGDNRLDRSEMLVMARAQMRNEEPMGGGQMQRGGSGGGRGRGGPGGGGGRPPG